jgi:hypothetical protein
MLLVRLDVLGIRKVSYSHLSQMINPQPDPPCSIPCALVNLSKEFMQFVPKAKYKGEDWYNPP